MSTQYEEGLTKTIARFKDALSTIRTGRANPDVLSKINVEYYGSMVPLKQLANISVPETMMLQLTLFDKGAVKAVEKGILASDLGLNPTVDGTIIRLRFPDLTEDRRKDLVKLTKKMAEEYRVAIRNQRRDALEKLKSDKTLPEDEVKKLQDEIQKQTDHYTKQVDSVSAEKEAEIMKI